MSSAEPRLSDCFLETERLQSLLEALITCGYLVVGPTIAECFSRMYYLERACKMQIATLSACRDPESELVWPCEEDCEFMAKAFQGGESVIAREWGALRRMLDSAGANYAD